MCSKTIVEGMVMLKLVFKRKVRTQHYNPTILQLKKKSESEVVQHFSHTAGEAAVCAANRN